MITMSIAPTKYVVDEPANIAAAPSVNTGVVVVAHAPMASALYSLAEQVLPEMVRSLLRFDIPQDMDRDVASSQIHRHVIAKRWDQVVVLVDVIGASPWFVAAEALQQRMRPGNTS